MSVSVQGTRLLGQLNSSLPFPTLLPLFSIMSPALISAFPPYSPAVFFPASTNPSTEFQMMFEIKLVIVQFV
jgi:hypothetical protein